MAFRITGLSAEPFRHLYGLSDRELALRGVKRYVADRSPGFPDRIEMRDAAVGEKLLLRQSSLPAGKYALSSHSCHICQRRGAGSPMIEWTKSRK